ncbi:MAG: hypothetical protein ACRDSS_13790, partial [Actinocrinis sp.]
CGLVSACHPGTPEVRATTPAAHASDTAAASEARALQSLQAWLAAPEAGTMSFSTIETNAADGGTSTSRQVSGRFDPVSLTGSQTGTRNVLGGGAPTTQDPVKLVELGGVMYSSIPTAQLPAYAGRTWFQNDLSTARATGSTHSVWWLALDQLDKVQRDGPSEVDAKSAVEFTGTVDLKTIPAAAAMLKKSAIFTSAGTTEVSFDLYTDLGTGALVRVTYRLGLQVSVDATPTANSTAGYQVDFGSFGVQPTPSSSPILAPNPTLVTASSTSSTMLCQLTLF